MKIQFMSTQTVSDEIVNAVKEALEIIYTSRTTGVDFQKTFRYSNDMVPASIFPIHTWDTEIREVLHSKKLDISIDQLYNALTQIMTFDNWEVSKTLYIYEYSVTNNANGDIFFINISLARKWESRVRR